MSPFDGVPSLLPSGFFSVFALDEPKIFGPKDVDRLLFNGSSCVEKSGGSGAIGSSAGFKTVPGAGIGIRSRTVAVSGANSSHAARETPAKVSAAAISATLFLSPSRIRTNGDRS